MSRSYRKFPLFRDTLWSGSHNRSMKAGKRHSNRKVRRKLKDLTVDISNGNYYKSLGTDSWDLYEYKHYQTRQDVIDEWEQKQKAKSSGVDTWQTNGDETLDEAILYWFMSYKRK